MQEWRWAGRPQWSKKSHWICMKKTCFTSSLQIMKCGSIRWCVLAAGHGWNGCNSAFDCQSLHSIKYFCRRTAFYWHRQSGCVLFTALVGGFWSVPKWCTWWCHRLPTRSALGWSAKLGIFLLCFSCCFVLFSLVEKCFKFCMRKCLFIGK